jgi:hypothetical protein
MGIVLTMVLAAALQAASPSKLGPARTAGTKARGFEVSPSERHAAAAGKLVAFWRSRSRIGDPVSCIALASLKPGGLPALCRVNAWVAVTRLVWFLPPRGANKARMRRIQVALMRAHVHEIDADRIGVPGLLSPRQIADYHHRVFAQFGLPYMTFGGTPLTGQQWESGFTALAWCRGCDSFGGAAR